jgi:hypothetical protein
VIVAGSSYKEVDMQGNTLRTFSLPYATIEAGWVDDTHLYSYHRDASYSYISLLDLNSGSVQPVCSIPRRTADTLDYPDEMTPVHLAYDKNNNSIYWSAMHHIFKVNITTGVIEKVWQGYDSIHFKDMAYSSKVGKFLMVAEEQDKKTHCGGTQDYTLYLMNEDGTDLRRINIPE